MTYAERFLHALGRQLSTMGLYGADHPSRAAGLSQVEEELRMLLRQNAFPVFSFLDGEVVYEDRVLPAMRHWDWSLKLARIGVERLEIKPGTTRQDLEEFLDELDARLNLHESGASVREVRGQTNIRFGEIGVQEAEQTVPVSSLDLSVEVEAVDWLFEEVQRTGEVPVEEAVTLVDLLAVAIGAESDVVIPLLQLRRVDQYTTTHSINVACLSMGLAESLNLSSTDVRAIGEAALLHDVGKTNIPLEILNKPGKLTEDEWRVMQSHTTEGARILLGSSRRMEFAAMVAYEHHLTWKGEGYPHLSYPRPPHPVSRLVQVCDVYDALRTRRPFRPPWPHTRATGFLRERAGEHMDPEYVDAFLRMIERNPPRQVIVKPVSEQAVA